MADDAGEISVQITANIAGLTAGLNAATAGVKESTDAMASSFTGVEGSTTEAFASMTNASERAAESMEGDFSRTEARHAAHMLGMNRAVGGFVATLPGVGQALSMAFAPLAIMEMVEWIAKGVEKMIVMHEAGQKLIDDQQAFETASQNALNSLDEKILEADKKVDELTGDHLGALNDQLKLIDMASMKDLVASFELIEKAADAVFKDLQSHWYTFGQGSDGAANALKDFKAQYDALLAAGDSKGASNLLSGTLQTAYDVLKAQQTIAANRASGEGTTDESYAAEQVLKAHNVSLAVTKSEVAAQQEMLETLGKQVMAEDRVNTLMKDNTIIAKAQANKPKKTGAAGDDAAPKDQSSEALAELTKGLEAEKDAKENWYNWSTGREIAYWQKMLGYTDQYSTMGLAITEKINRLQREQAEKSEADKEKDAGRDFSAAKEGSNERIVIASQEFDRIKAIFDATTEQYKAAQAKMTEAIRQAQDAREKIQAQADKRLEIEETRAIDKRISEEKRAANSIANGFAQMSLGMIQGSKSFAQTATELADKMAENVVRSLMRGMMTHIMVEQTKTVATAAGTATRDGMERTSNLKSLMGSANSAAAKSWDWASAWGGPIAGAIAAAATWAGVMAFDSFDNGGLVQQTGLVFAHQGEGVLTAPTTQMLQNMNKLINGGGANSPLSTAASASGGGDVHNHFNGCFDPKTFFQQHQGPMMAAIKDGMKNRRG